VTTRLPLESWLRIVGSERLTEAWLGRLTRHMRVRAVSGPRYRLWESKYRVQTEAPTFDERDHTDPEARRREDGRSK
jgi:IstB-like ATP binding protein